MEKSTLISGATIVNVEAGRLQFNQSIAIRDGRIHTIADVIPGRFTETLDAQGAFICPGLIDAHVHLFLDASPDPRTAFLQAGDAAKLRVAAQNAARALSAGVTTVRDCGGPAQLLFQFQRSIERGDVPGPRILSAGSPLTRPGGHCHFFGIEVASVGEVRSAIEHQAREGAVFVKLIASGGGLTPGTRPSEADLPLELMREAVAVAKAHGLPVAAHCHAVESIERALDAGVDIIEHASFVRPEGPPQFDPRIAARIKDQGTVVSPTAIAGVRIAQSIRSSGAKNGADPDAIVRLEARRQHTARFYRAGVRIIAGTDCGVQNTTFDALVDELAEYVGAGMSQAEALRSATSASAHYLQQPMIGQVKPGCFADLLFLPSNPLQSLECLRSPLLVMKEGNIVCDRRSLLTSVS